MGCAAAVFDPTGERILLVRRADSGRWCVPGGYMDAGEGVVEGCVREVWEETGLTVRVTRLIGVYTNPHVLLVHLEVWRTLRALGQLGPEEQRYVATVEESALYFDPHICTACRYRADDMLWRCPHCHEWNTFVEERVGPAAGGQP